MAAPKSQDLRERVIAAVEAGHSRREAARRFQVGIKTAITWVKQWRDGHGMTPAGQGGDRRSHRIETYRDDLIGWITAEPDITLAELQDRLWRHYACWVGIGSLSRFCQRHGYSYKKRVRMPASSSAGTSSNGD